ncbi:hypothetical protein BC363_32965 [Ensifer sp. LC384]|nr:hypothetical protein BC363_32965 [Ensifer sp. LC384]
MTIHIFGTSSSLTARFFLMLLLSAWDISNLQNRMMKSLRLLAELLAGSMRWDAEVLDIRWRTRSIFLTDWVRVVGGRGK